jgi:hypothetical protein
LAANRSLGNHTPHLSRAQRRPFKRKKCKARKTDIAFEATQATPGTVKCETGDKPKGFNIWIRQISFGSELINGHVDLSLIVIFKLASLSLASEVKHLVKQISI